VLFIVVNSDAKKISKFLHEISKNQRKFDNQTFISEHFLIEWLK